MWSKGEVFKITTCDLKGASASAPARPTKAQHQADMERARMLRAEYQGRKARATRTNRRKRASARLPVAQEEMTWP